MQTTSHILMVRPTAFGFNPETAVNNLFQVADADTNINEKAQIEFDNFVQVLRSAGVHVVVVEDRMEPPTPDSVFPNNWVSFHADGTIVLYPMFAVNRRWERDKEVLAKLEKMFVHRSVFDLTHYEADEKFLEGTGSMILDREAKIVYACLSPRTDREVLNIFCEKLAYRPVVFTAVDSGGTAIYHTNVMMCVADSYVVICLESIIDEKEREQVVKEITQSGKQIIPISLQQVHHFAGNMLQVQNQQAERYLVMSSQAYRSLTKEQVKQLEQYNPILHAPLDAIEQNGGGSARCMLAEIFLPEKS